MGWTKTRSELANALQANPDADVTDLRRRLKAERLEDAVQRAVDSAPPLNADQRARIARLLIAPTKVG